MIKKLSMKLIGITFILLMFTGLVFAAPGIPHQFYGEVLVNGAPAQDGLLVTAKIDGQDVAVTTTHDSYYGYVPYKFYIQDPNSNRIGKTVEFYVNGVFTGQTAIFQNGESTQVDLSVTLASTPTPSPAPTTSRSSGGGGGSGYVAPTVVVDNTTENQTQEESSDVDETQLTVTTQSAACESEWICSDWLDCVNGQQKRVCIDKNGCSVEKQETQVCDLPVDPTLQPERTGLSAITGAVLGGGTGSIAALVILVLAVVGLLGVYTYAKSKKE